MAETQLNAKLAITRWRARYFDEYTRASRFRPYMGTGLDNIIVTMHELETQAGKTIIVPFLGELTGPGVSGGQVLEGNEEQLSQDGMPVTIEWRRNAVIVPKSEQFKTDIDLLNAAKPRLRRWEANLLRKDIIREMAAMTQSDGSSIPYANATEQQKDDWLSLNGSATGDKNRVLFGADIANQSGNDHSASLANIDTTSDRANYAWVTKIKRMAVEADITPYQSDQMAGEEWFVLFVGSRTFRDLEIDPTIVQFDSEARKRGLDEKNPIWQGGDLLVRGVIIRQEPEIDVLEGVGASSSDVQPAFLCGGGAVAIAWGQTPQSKTRLTDYDFRRGVAIEELLGVKKINMSGVQRSIVTAYVSAPADA